MDGKRVDFGHIFLPNTPVMQRYTLRPVPEYPDDYVPPSIQQIQQIQPPEPVPAAMPEPVAEPAEGEGHDEDADPDSGEDHDDTDHDEEHEDDGDPDGDE